MAAPADVTFHEPTREALGELAAAMRLDDVRELRAAGFSPFKGLELSCAQSEECHLARFSGEPAAVFGVWPAFPPATLLGRPGYGVWMLTGVTVQRHPVTFMRCCRAILPQLVERYGTLANFVDARHQVALRWARRLGFEVLAHVPYGPWALPFHPIIARSPACA